MWTSRAADTYRSTTIQYIAQSWELHAWCLGCSGLNSDHTGESLREAFDEVVTEEWKLDIAKQQTMHPTTERPLKMTTYGSLALATTCTWLLARPSTLTVYLQPCQGCAKPHLASPGHQICCDNSKQNKNNLHSQNTIWYMMRPPVGMPHMIWWRDSWSSSNLCVQSWQRTEKNGTWCQKTVTSQS